MTKLISEITPEDFEQSKVWKYHGNEDATATVEPTLKTELAEDDIDVYLAFTEFRLADGTILSGFASPADDSGLDYLQPVIFHDGRPLTLWSEPKGVVDVSRNLSKNVNEVYPIYWRSEVLVDGEVRTGYITL